MTVTRGQVGGKMSDTCEMLVRRGTLSLDEPTEYRREACGKLAVVRVRVGFRDVPVCPAHARKLVGGAALA